MSAFGGIADIGVVNLEGHHAMKLFEFNDGGMSGRPPSLFAYRQGPVSFTAPPR
jgi:hypothetical protein